MAQSNKPRKRPSVRKPAGKTPRQTYAGKAPKKQLAGKASRRQPGGRTLGGKTLAGKTFRPQKTAYQRKPGRKAPFEIRKFQKSWDLLIPKAPFARVVKEIMFERNPELRIQAVALSAIKEAAEALLVAEFEMTQLAAIHAKRVTIQVKDMKLVQAMRRGMLGVFKVGEL